MIDGFSASLFGRHELWRSRNDSAASHAGIVHGSCEAKVGQHGSLDVALQQDISRFDVSMNEPLLMRCLQTTSGLDADPQNLFRAKLPVASNAFLQRLAVDKWHH